jgi:hypothetical protein
MKFFLEKFRKCIPPPKIERLMVPSENAPQELSNEWSADFYNLTFFGKFPTLW